MIDEKILLAKIKELTKYIRYEENAGYNDALRDIEEFVNSLNKESKTIHIVNPTFAPISTEPNKDGSVEDASKEYAMCMHLPPYRDIDIQNAFKAGVKWQSEQGVSWEDKMTYYDGFLLYGEDERAYTMEGNFNEGDKVIVQIRKK